ncbi:MAG: orotate phosphoribosyltransferase [Phycisphaerales bacterium]|nr:orotate phosphoribosyltransferase [Phycisphaerales bacterium]
MNDAQLAIALREAAFLEGDFTLRSGRKSKYYLDKYLFETRPDILRELAKRFAKHITPTMTRIAGPELGAVALAAATSLETGLPFVIVRNAKKADYGTGKLIEGAFEPGDRVILVEDIATSGGQAIEAAKTLTAAGVTVEKVVVVIDREEGGVAAIADAGFPCDSLFTTTALGVRKDG